LLLKQRLRPNAAKCRDGVWPGYSAEWNTGIANDDYSTQLMTVVRVTVNVYSYLEQLMARAFAKISLHPMSKGKAEMGKPHDVTERPNSGYRSSGAE